MRPLSPPLKVIEGNLSMLSISSLLRWTSNDPGLSSKTVKALKNDPIAKELRTEFKKQDNAPVIENNEDDVPLPSFLNELIERRIAARDCYASSTPSPGQILRLDQIVGPDQKVVQDLANPLAILIEKSAQNLWRGWMVASETDYAGYWDMLLEPEDEPFDPLAGMIQIWNPVQVYIPSEAPVLAELKPARLQAVRALAEEFANEPELDISMSRPGFIAPRMTVGNFSILTGTHFGNLNTDPRHRYKDLYHTAAETLRDVALQSSRPRVSLAQRLQKQVLETIISLVIPPLEQIKSECTDKTTEQTVLSINGQPSVEEKDSNLTVYHNEDSWMLSFRTVLPELVNKSVFLIIIDSGGKEIIHQLQKLENDDDVWMFEYSLPKTMKQPESYTIKIQSPNDEE